MDLTPDQVRTQLAHLLGSDLLSKSTASKRLLTYLVERSLSAPDGPKEVEIAIDIFGRNASFSGGEDAAVRVAIRGLRQKLLEYYNGPGHADALIFDIPKGAYRVTVTPRSDPSRAIPPPGTLPQQPLEPQAHAPAPPLPPPGHGYWWKRAGIGVAIALLVLLVARTYPWSDEVSAEEATRRTVRQDPFWTPLATERPLVFVLGDLFMYTQADSQTGRLQTVRDPQINSSDDLRLFLAGNPSLAADRGLRYSSMIQKSTAVGMVQILRVLDSPGRRIEVRLRDELQAEDIRTADIIYVGPIARVGPLANDNHLRSRYHYDPVTGSIRDTRSEQTYMPEGDLGGHRKDYALVTGYTGPAGNRILVLTAGGRNAGLLQIVHSFTSPEGLEKFWQAAARRDLPPAFEALMAVSGYKQTDLSADLIQLHPLPVE
jgi:hypothetical protein